MLVSKIGDLINSLKWDYELYRNVKPCLDACNDKLSRSIIKARLNYYSLFLSRYKRYLPWVRNSDCRFCKRINKLINPIYRINSLDSISGKSIVVLGSGDYYKYTISLLQRSDWRNNFRCIGDSLDKLVTIKRNEILIMAGPSAFRDHSLYRTIKTNHPNVHIFERDFLLVGETRNQYLDVFVPNQEEIVIDCGAFDGKTEEQIINWGGNNVKKIYAFEIDSLNKKRCLMFYEEKGLNNIVEFINKGVSNKNDIVYLESNSLGSSGSRIGQGDNKARIVKLDDEIKGKVTMIKMDIEGAELDALKGAKKLLQYQKPRLAICIYHKLEDIYEIPSYLLSIVPEYRFIIRHYSSYTWETVLYAYVP